ncbi:MarR family winged helix-turn-helix transcriptional regulator [Faecalibaculum rodentium]|jgi:DNA-binding MarR family transcriptional regulator|uniref:MarR family winged helix-turn-helix transcriptional regulator n=1 Tax=Faecalibaculum rodentium TaxID=1702221 RepID=UPI00256ED856|nr:MarR family transcriptional regulator [Faecalibaculum rodentium]
MEKERDVLTYEGLAEKFSDSPARQGRAVFSMLFILTNRLQTLFDNHIPEVTLKQFMLLSVIRQADQPKTLTEMGTFLGCSRQNVKKLAEVLERKGFVSISRSPKDPRATVIAPAEKADRFFREDFRKYQDELQELFTVYSADQLRELLWLLTRMVEGVDRLEKYTEQDQVRSQRKGKGN